MDTAILQGTFRKQSGYAGGRLQCGDLFPLFAELGVVLLAVLDERLPTHRNRARAQPDTLRVNLVLRVTGLPALHRFQGEAVVVFDLEPDVVSLVVAQVAQVAAVGAVLRVQNLQRLGKQEVVVVPRLVGAFTQDERGGSQVVFQGRADG